MVHGFDVKMLELMQAIRHKKNIWMDLSYTLTKRKGLLHELMITDVCLNLSERVIIGSDYPFDHPDITYKKITNILNNNGSNHLLDKILKFNALNLLSTS